MKLEIDSKLSELIAKAQLEAPGDMVVLIEYYGEHGDVTEDHAYIRDANTDELFAPASEEMTEIVVNILWYLVDRLRPGWDQEYGGSGSITLDLGAGTITWRHHTNVVHQELTEQIGEFCGNTQSREEPAQQNADGAGGQPS